MESSETYNFAVGQRVQVSGRDVCGTIGYIGTTSFASGKWIGVILDEPKGKNNGSFQGIVYFEAPENHGLFVRQAQLVPIQSDTISTPPVASSQTTKRTPPSGTSSKISPKSASGGTGDSETSKPAKAVRSSKPMSQAQRRTQLTRIPGFGRFSVSAHVEMDSCSTKSTIVTSAEPTKKLESTPINAENCFTIDSGMERFVMTSKISRLPRNSFLKRLPIAGGQKETPKSFQQTSPSTSKSNLTTPTSAKGDGNTSKRQSFTETIAETIVPQYTQGPQYTPTITPGSGGLQAEDRFGAAQLIESLKYEVKDLTEKLEVLKTKRAADVDKIREVDRLRLQIETLSEFKSKVLESQASLQKELKKVKQDARDSIDLKDKQAEELTVLAESVEMLTLDKEMAEEKAETLQMELDQANERIAELATEISAMKDEMSGNIDPELKGANSVLLKKLEEENKRLRDGLLKLRDTIAHDKHQLQKLSKEVEVNKSEISDLSKAKEKLDARCKELEAEVADLQEMNDAALGAEEMVVNLTEKNLNLEEKVKQLAESVADLEALQDVNEQLQENAKEVEMELRDELRQAVIANSNAMREKEALLETLGDREMTIAKFRELVQKLREENEILRKNLEEESSKTVPILAEALDFKKIFAETRAQTTAIDLELRRLEAKEATLHVALISNFMPEGFMKRGGDNEALLILLLIPRLTCKVELLLNQIKDKIIPISLADNTLSIEEISSSPEVEKYAFSCQFTFLLHSLLSELHRWTTALNSCSTEEFLKIGLLYPDLSVQEKSVDFYLELLRKSQLDENIPLDGLEKCISSFQMFYSVHLSEEHILASALVSDLCLASAAASDCLVVNAARLLHLLKKTEGESNVAGLLQDVKAICESLRQLAKRTRRCLPDSPKQPPVSNKLQSELLNDSVMLTKIVKVFQEACKLTAHHSGLGAGDERILSSKMEEYFQSAMEKCDSHVEGAAGFKEIIKERLTTALVTMTDLAQVVNEAPVPPKEKPPTPLSLRAQAVRAELDESRNLKFQLQEKETAIEELRQLIRSKQDELSQATIRKELAEKKLMNSSKENEMTIEKLTRKLEDTQMVLQRKEREFQATLEHFQSEIEAMENEKGELREKLVTASKRRLVEGIQAAASPVSSPSHSSKYSSQQVQQNTEIVSVGDPTSSQGLMEYTRYLQRQNWRLKSERVLEIVKDLKPLNLPNKEHFECVRQFQKEYWKLKHESNHLLCESMRVTLNKQLTPARKQYLLEMIDCRKSDLSKKIRELKSRVDAYVAERPNSGVIKAHFANFYPNPSEKESEKEAVKVGMIRFPGWEKSEEKPKKVFLTKEQLKEIHRLLAPI